MGGGAAGAAGGSLVGAATSGMARPVRSRSPAPIRVVSGGGAVGMGAGIGATGAGGAGGVGRTAFRPSLVWPRLRKAAARRQSRAGNRKTWNRSTTRRCTDSSRSRAETRLRWSR